MRLLMVISALALTTPCRAQERDPLPAERWQRYAEEQAAAEQLKRWLDYGLLAACGAAVSLCAYSAWGQSAALRRHAEDLARLEQWCREYAGREEARSCKIVEILERVDGRLAGGADGAESAGDAKPRNLPADGSSHRTS